MPHRLLTLILLLGFLCFAPDAGAQLLNFKSGKGGFVLQNADSFYRDSDRKIMVLQGNVQVMYDDQHMSCDRAIIYEATQEIEAEGHFRMTSATVLAEGDRARFNYQTGEGVIYNGFVRSGQVVFEGRIVKKVGPEDYEAEAAYYTACTTCPPSWSFTGSRINAKLGGYAFIRNAVVEIAHFPVFWLPYLVVPLKSDRQTGLLIPTLDFTGPGGTAIGESFFWAINRSQDATFTLKNYSFRGLKGLTNYRYMLSETSSGEGNFGILQDRVFAGDPAYRGGLSGFRQRPSKFTRWFVTFSNIYELPEGYTQRLQINSASDRFYARDFRDEIGGYGDPAMENRLSLTKNTEFTHASLDVLHYTNMLRVDQLPSAGVNDPLPLDYDPIADNSDSVHRFPELRYSMIDRPLGNTGLIYRFDTNYVNFSREDFGYDDVAGPPGARSVDTKRGTYGPGLYRGNGVFDPDLDVVRAGQRFDFQPEISRPFMIGRALDILPVVSLRYTQYAFDVSPAAGSSFDTSPSRQYLRGQLIARTRFDRVYGISPGELRDDRYKHEIEPVLSLSTLPWVSETNHSFFGRQTRIPPFREAEPVSDADFQSSRGIQFDYFDRIPTRNFVTLGFNNRLIKKQWVADAAEYRQIVNLRIQQSYDIDEANRKTPPQYPWSDIATLLDVTLDRFAMNADVRYYPYHNKTNTTTKVRLMNRRNDFVQLRLQQTYTISEPLRSRFAEQNRPTENVGFDVGFNHKYVSVEAGVDYQPNNIEQVSLKTKSWYTNLAIRPPGECWMVQALLRQDVGLAPEARLKFEYNFGGTFF